MNRTYIARRLRIANHAAARMDYPPTSAFYAEQKAVSEPRMKNFDRCPREWRDLHNAYPSRDAWLMMANGADPQSAARELRERHGRPIT